jgi:hypothetical protein
MLNDKEMWVMSILSDAQELIDRGYKQESIDKINAAKRVLQGKYKVLDDGMSIQVEQRVRP